MLHFFMIFNETWNIIKTVSSRNLSVIGLFDLFIALQILNVVVCREEDIGMQMQPGRAAAG